MKGRRRRTDVTGRRRVAPILFLLALVTAGPARGGTEEFSTFHVESMEEDDESVLDHLLVRAPADWRAEWERAPLGLRTAQGCLTSGQWFTDTDLKLSTPLGKRARFGLELNQVAGDIATYDFLDLWFRFPVRFGTLGVMFRPFHDKSRQDLALAWEQGADSSAFQLRATYGFEDLFNNLWAFRQTRVGERSEPYLVHPWEPALELALRRERWRAELAGKWLTPSTKGTEPTTPGGPEHHETLWGTLVRAAAEVHSGGFTCELRGWNQQALGTDQPLDYSTGDGSDFRRAWSVEMGVGHRLARRVTASVRYHYLERTEHYGPPVGPGRFEAYDRVLQGETVHAFAPWIALRLGGLYDRITIVKSGVTRYFSYGTRKESRAYFGLTARFGNVSVSGVEGIELDSEPYDVWFVHDKGFLSLQATF